MDSRLQRIAAVALLGSSLACGVGYKPAVSAGQIADSARPGDLLVEYLGATAADPIVCDVSRRDGAALTVVNAGVVRRLGDGLTDGLVPPERWAACSLLLWSGADAELRRHLGEDLVARLRSALEGELASLASQARLAAVIAVCERRPADAVLPATALRDVLERAAERSRSATDEVRPVLDEAVARLEIEGGLFDGTPVDAARIGAATDEGDLAIWARRHPDVAVREAAGARLLALRLPRVPARWRDAARVAVDEHGFFPIPDDAVVVPAAWEPGPDDAVMLRLLQDPKRGTVRLLPAARDASRDADASLDLRGALKVRVDGVGEALTLCPGADPWDPTPCLPPARLRMAHPVAALAPTGRIVFPEELALDEFLRLGGDGDRLAAQVVVGGVVAPIDLPIAFESVESFTYTLFMDTAAPGRIVVDVWELSHDRLLIEYSAAFERRRVLVPISDTSFRVRAVLDEDVTRGPEFLVRTRCTNCATVDAALRRMITSQRGTVAVEHVAD